MARDRPYWPETAGRPELEPTAEPPARTDVVVVGGGYTGLAAARTLARGGADVTLLERATLGAGASLRNGGFVLPGYRRDAVSLVRRFGAVRARILFDASRAALRHLEAFLAAEGADCDFHGNGHLTLAAKPSHYAVLARQAEVLEKVFRHPTELVPRERLDQELGGHAHYGGLLDPAGAGINPAKLFWTLAASARRAGARLVEDAEVRSVHRSAGRFTVRTSRGTVGAAHVVVATNGHTAGVVPALRRRVVPVGSYGIATAPLGQSVARALVPRDRVVSDTRRLPIHFRIAPDTRMLFGGRVGFGPQDIRDVIRQLNETMCALFPRLLGTDIDHYWSGTLGMTLDLLPHAGVRDGVHYAVGFNGHGVALALYLGHRVGEAAAGRGSLDPFSHAAFRAVPLYFGHPWFLPLVGTYYRLRDSMG